MTTPLIARAEQHDYQKLFIQELNWSRPDQPPITIEHEGRKVTATNVSSYKGLRIWVVNEKPNSKLEAALDQHLAQNSTDRILIVHDDTEQVWRWPVRRATGNTTTTRLSRHRHRTGDTDPRFAEKLDAIRLPFDITLDSNAVLAKVRQAFDVEAHNETKHASKLMARLYAAMEKAYPTTTPRAVRDHEISVTLARILFLMFGDDTDMWKANLFSNFIRDHTDPDGSNIGAQLTTLFDYLDISDDQRGTPEPGLEGFRYVNGRIFTERLTLPILNAEFRTAVLEAGDRDWATISPAIFGSMFQSVRDAETRRQLGEHYTSEENILKTLNPLFLDELRAEFEHIRTLGKYEADRLRKLRDKIGRIRYMDPACGCGNFIIVAYRELRDLELAIMERLQEITGDNPMVLANYGLKVSLDHFYGIEIDEWPARIAETAMFLVDRQCDLKLTASLGYAPDRLPIQEQATIVVDNALRVDWSSICPQDGDLVIAGNPPFIGHYTRTTVQTEDMKQAWGKDYSGRLDYVTAWHAKAKNLLAERSGEFAYVTTNSITQGLPVPALFGPLYREGWTIKFAHRTFAWDSEAPGKAAVHCVIVGFTRDRQARRRLWDYPNVKSEPVEQKITTGINAYLIDGPEVLVDRTSDPLSPEMTQVHFGTMPADGGNLVFKPEEGTRGLDQDPVAAKYLRRFVGAREVLHSIERWCLWLEGLTPADQKSSKGIQDAIEASQEWRSQQKPTGDAYKLKNTPHLFRPNRNRPKVPYLCIPRHVSENRRYWLAARYGPEVISGDANFQAPDEDGLLFSLVSSSMFMAWQRAVGGRIKSDLRFSNKLTWNTFPVPDLDNQVRNRVIDAGRAVLDARAERPDQTLADLYDPYLMGEHKPLQKAHDDLDREVDRVFGAPRLLANDKQRLELLFPVYQQLVEIS